MTAMSFEVWKLAQNFQIGNKRKLMISKYLQVILKHWKVYQTIAFNLKVFASSYLKFVSPYLKFASHSGGRYEVAAYFWSFAMYFDLKL